MSKRVHFARTTTIYSTGSATPSPSMSVSSLPSSSSPDLPTPPPEEEDYEYSPTVVFPTTPFSNQKQLDSFSPDIPTIPKPIQIHLLLAFTPFNDAAVPWDMSYPLSAMLPSLEGFLDLQTLAEPATSPPLPSLLITHPNLKWNVEVLPRESTPGAYVSVNDVFETLYRELRLAIHPIEYAEIQEGEMRPSVDAAFWNRLARFRDQQLRTMEHMKGIKKIDLLVGKTRFLGLSGTLTAADIWELNVA